MNFVVVVLQIIFLGTMVLRVVVAVDYYDDQFGMLDLEEQKCDCCEEEDEE